MCTKAPLCLTVISAIFHKILLITQSEFLLAKNEVSNNERLKLKRSMISKFSFHTASLFLMERALKDAINYSH